MNTASKFLLLAAFLAIPSVAGVTAAPPEKNADKKPEAKTIVVPFELLKSRHMAIQVMINGKGPYRLIFDTGAPTNLINNKTAKDAGVLKKDDKGGMAMFGMSGAKVIDTLEIGDVKMEKVPVMVMDHPTVKAISEALGPIEGLIGFPFFARYKTTVDYQKKELTFTPNGYVPSDAMQSLMEKLTKGGGKQGAAIVAPAAVWGFTVDKGDADEEAGVTVKEVLSGSAAAAGGLKVGDRVLTLDGRWTDSIADTFTAASLVKPGREAVVVVKRGDKEVKLSVKPVKGV
jgi:Aspartyl protease/PDZ domain